MKRLTIFLTILFCFAMVIDTGAKPKKKTKKRARTTRVVKRKKVTPPTIHENPYLVCEDTCNHVHGIDMSHYQGEVFWETVGEKTKMSYVYLKATEGGDRIDSQYERNIDLAHRHGLKVGSYHFFRPTVNLYSQLQNFMTQCLPGEQDLIPMLDVETTGKLSDREFCDSLHKFLEYHLMVAMYADEPPVLADKRDYIIWQYTCKGRILGVSGEVDKSCLMGDHELRELRFIH